MARKTKTALDYFPLDLDFFLDDKIEPISARFGLKGEAIIIRLLCKIYRNGYFLKWDSEDTARVFAKGVGDFSLYSLVNDVVYELIRRGFFDKSIFDSFGVLTSPGIQERFIEASQRRKSVEIYSEYLLINLSEWKNVNIISLNVNINKDNVDISTQSKVKESKVNDSRDINADAREESFPSGIQALKYFISLWDESVEDKFRFKGTGPSSILTDKFNRYEVLRNKKNLKQLIHARITIPEFNDKGWGYFFGERNFFDMIITNGYQSNGNKSKTNSNPRPATDYEKRAAGKITDESIRNAQQRLAEIEGELVGNDQSE